MSPELETLDQLIGNDIPLAIIRGLFADGERFDKAVTAMLDSGEVRFGADGGEVPRWRWREMLASEAEAKLTITEAGVRRIGG